MLWNLFAVIALGLALTLPAAVGKQGEQASVVRSNSLSSKIITLDLHGRRGLVFYDHKLHESLVSPDPDYRYKAKTSAACSGCHHTADEMGVAQLIKCRACHLEEGNPRNPKSLDMVEQTTDEAFHRNCMGCHRAAQKGPRLCVACHKMVPNQ